MKKTLIALSAVACAGVLLSQVTYRSTDGFKFDGPLQSLVVDGSVTADSATVGGTLDVTNTATFRGSASVATNLTVVGSIFANLLSVTNGITLSELAELPVGITAGTGRLAAYGGKIYWVDEDDYAWDLTVSPTEDIRTGDNTWSGASNVFEGDVYVEGTFNLDEITVNSVVTDWQEGTADGTNWVIDLDDGYFWYLNAATNVHIIVSNAVPGASGKLIIHGGGASRGLSAVTGNKKPATITWPYLFTNDLRIAYDIGQATEATNVYFNPVRF